jgi:hypothetical protein
LHPLQTSSPYVVEHIPTHGVLVFFCIKGILATFLGVYVRSI